MVHPLISSTLLLLIALSPIATCTPDTAVKSVLCNSATYTSGDPFAASLATVLAELEAVTPSHQGHDFHNISPYPNAFAYGHATCNHTLTLTGSDCVACLTAAKTAMLGACARRIGARAVLADCSIRYEQYPFDH